MTDTFNDRAWRQFLRDNPTVLMTINCHGYCDIESWHLKPYREPRLMCKIDFLEQRPKVLQNEQLSVLATANKKYRLARTSPFLTIDTTQMHHRTAEKIFSLPSHVQSLAATHITSESKALDAAYVSGMLHELEQTNDLNLTVRGRSYSTDFEFALADVYGSPIYYQIAGVQLEVDGGYESPERLLLIEAKMGFSNNMNLRQLLYPQLNYSKLINKPVVTYLMFYEAGGFFHFLPFIYSNNEPWFDYQGYRLFQLEQSVEIDASALFKTRIDNELTGFGAPFPQADRMDTLLNLLLSMATDDVFMKEELFSDYDLVPRQWDYYLNALIWLGLMYWVDRGVLQLTPQGRQLASLTEHERVYAVAQIVFSNEIFNAYLNLDNPDISPELRRRNGLSTDSTFSRRMQTVKAWRKYLLHVLNLHGRI